MKVYLSGSIAGEREFAKGIRTISDTLEELGHTILTPFVVDEKLNKQRFSSLVGVKKSHAIVKEDRKLLRKCDALVAEVSTYSHGVGYEHAYAESLGKPVLLLRHSNLKNKKYSAFLDGSTHKKFDFSFYSQRNINEILNKFLNRITRSNKRKKGRFVVIEGGVGGGKSSVFNKLKRNYKDWKFYREPGSTRYGERVRKAVQGRYGYPVDRYAAMFGYSSARANLIRRKVIPALKSNKTVLLDRYWYSTYAYQGSEGVDKNEIIEISKFATDDLIPDLIIHLDQNPKIGMVRKMGKRDADRYDEKNISFHIKIRKNYLELGKKLGKIWVRIDASQDRKKVYDNVIEELKKSRIIN